MAGFLCFLVSMVPSPWAVDASESAAYLVEVALGRYSPGLITEWSLPDDLIMIGLLLLCRIILMS